MSRKKSGKPPIQKNKKPTVTKAEPSPKEKTIWVDHKDPEDHFYRKIFLGLSAFMVVVMILLSFSAGINADDSYQVKYSENIVNFYTTFGKDKAALENVHIGTSQAPMQYYGGFYELMAGGINRVMGYTEYDPAYHNIRQMLIAIFGFFAMVFTGLFVREIAGWRAGILALLLMFLSPRFLGHSTMNPKDIPYAAGFAISLYFLIRILKHMPKPDWREALGFSLGVGIALGTRAGGLLVIAYAGLFAGIDFLARYGLKGLGTHFKMIYKYLIYIGGTSIIGYIIAVLFWPAALVSPIKFPLEALTEFSKFGTAIRLLFQGDNVMSDTTPWYYGVVWIAKTIPLFTLIGLAGSFAVLPALLRKYSRVAVLLAYFAVFFPLLYIVYKGSSLYDGWRHLLFIYPPMVILASLFWAHLEQLFAENATAKKAIWAILGILMLIPAIFIARNPAYPYTYFNPIGGGIQGAFGNYETDYWGISCKQAIRWMEKEGILSENMKDTLYIGTTFQYNVSRQLDPSYAGKVKVRYVRFGERYTASWDYGIFPSRFYRGPQLRAGYWPNSKSIHSVKANAVVLTTIEKDENHYAFQGEQALKANDFTKAIEQFTLEVQAFPDNELAWGGLLRAYLNTGRLDEAIVAGQEMLKLAPENENALMMLGVAYLNKGDLDTADQMLQENVRINPKNATAFYYLALVYDKKNNYAEGVSYATKAITANPRFKNAYSLAADLYQKMGDAASAERYRQAAAKMQ